MTRPRVLVLTVLSCIPAAGLIAVLAYVGAPVPVQLASFVGLLAPVLVFVLGMGAASRAHEALAREVERQQWLEAKRTRPERDPTVTMDEMLSTLALWTFPGEVSHVRQQIRSGDFTLDQLDDLIHHRRTQALEPRKQA